MSPPIANIQWFFMGFQTRWAALLPWLTLTAAAQTSPHLANLRQLTFGGQNAEAYWSPDGRRLIFQSTREPYRCDQIFLMNADGSDVRLVSTGKGRTTCAYFLGDGKHILYASTHEGGEECPPPPDRSRSKVYVWAIYPTYDIYLATEDGRLVKKLTDSPGYDAEATVCWKTGKIVYTSLASGDLDLWIMNSDGSGKRQITNRVGYDGGAVFSRDGKKLVWRAHYPQEPGAVTEYKQLLARHLIAPSRVEIFLADGDGRHPRQLTRFGCAAFAPTFTPDGKKIVFASNHHACDSRNFELYMMNLDGSGLERLTNFGGFVSFPEFSPDGKYLVFASDYGAKSRFEFNIFVAEWK
jgi:Tol biopolymer transport system component